MEICIIVENRLLFSLTIFRDRERVNEANRKELSTLFILQPQSPLLMQLPSIYLSIFFSLSLSFDSIFWRRVNEIYFDVRILNQNLPDYCYLFFVRDVNLCSVAEVETQRGKEREREIRFILLTRKKRNKTLPVNLFDYFLSISAISALFSFVWMKIQSLFNRKS